MAEVLDLLKRTVWYLRWFVPLFLVHALPQLQTRDCVIRMGFSPRDSAGTSGGPPTEAPLAPRLITEEGRLSEAVFANQ